MKKQEKYHSIKTKFKFVAAALSWTTFVLLLIVGGFLLYYFIATRVYAQKGDDFKPAFGLYTIVSPSMEPNLKIYDVIVNVNIKKPEDIKVGDVITFISTASISKGMTITHRVISITDGENGKLYQTKGDNNLSPDSAPVPYENILGKVILKLPQLGRLQGFLATKGGWLIVVVIPAMIIILSDVMKLFRLKDAQKNVDDLTKKENELEKKEIEKKKEIQTKLTEKYKPRRSVYENDPLKRDSVIISVGNTKTKTKPKTNSAELPKLKDNSKPVKKKRRYYNQKNHK